MHLINLRSLSLYKVQQGTHVRLMCLPHLVPDHAPN